VWAAQLASRSHRSQPRRQGERGALVAARGDLAAQSLTLTMEDAGDRCVAILHDEARVLTGLTLLLHWHLGRSLVQIASLEVRP
jgi:hypothetical protein